MKYFGHITAGDTAPTAVPITAASSTDTPSRRRARMITPIISKQPATEYIRMAGRSTFFRYSKLCASPARVRMIINASWRKSVEIERIAPSSTFSTCGADRARYRLSQVRKVSCFHSNLDFFINAQQTTHGLLSRPCAFKYAEFLYSLP